jgi:hypothetical protein
MYSVRSTQIEIRGSRETALELVQRKGCSILKEYVSNIQPYCESLEKTLIKSLSVDDNISFSQDNFWGDTAILLNVIMVDEWGGN